jgi:hypothetical protein
MKYENIIYTIGCILLFYLIIRWGSMLVVNRINCGCKEGLTDFEEYSRKIIPYPKDAEINYNDLNSPLYTQTVNMPFNSPYRCTNFCGPPARCVKTGEQCSTDIDCYGCNPGPTPMPKYETAEIDPYDNGGKLGQNQGLQYSPLTTGYDNHNIDFAEVYPGSKDAQIKRPYQGVDLWTKSFNTGLQLYNKKRESHDKYDQGISQNIIDSSSGKPYGKAPNYPTTITATGQFYDTLPPASNSYLN